MRLQINPIPYSLAEAKHDYAHNEVKANALQKSDWLMVLYDKEKAKRFFYSEYELKQWLGGKIDQVKVENIESDYESEEEDAVPQEGESGLSGINQKMQGEQSPRRKIVTRVIQKK